MAGPATLGAVEVIGTALGLGGEIALDAGTLAALSGLGAGANAFVGVDGNTSGFTTLASYDQAIQNGANTNTNPNLQFSNQQIYNQVYQQSIASGLPPTQAATNASLASAGGLSSTSANIAGGAIGSATAPVEGGTLGAVTSSGVVGGGLPSGISGAVTGGVVGAGVGAGVGSIVGRTGSVGTPGSTTSTTPSPSTPTNPATTAPVASGVSGGLLGGLSPSNIVPALTGIGGIVTGLTGGLNTSAPNPGDVAGNILQDEINFAPSILSTTQQNAPQYANLQSGLLSSSASSLVSSYGSTAPALQNIQTGLNSQQASGNQQLISQYGGSTISALLAANPQLAQTQTSLTNLANGGINQPGTTGVQQAQNSTLGQLAQTAQSQLALGTSISPQEQATVANQVLSNYNSMGRANDPTAIAGLATGLDTYGQQLLTSREAASSNAAGLVTQQNTANQSAQATNLQGQLSALGGAGSLALNSQAPAVTSLLTPSQGVTQTQNTTAQAGTSLQNASALSGMYNPFNSAAYGPAYSANTQANQINAQTNAGLVSGGLGLLGSALGSSSSLSSLLSGFCWIAREVYGEDNPKWVKARTWMMTRAPNSLFWFYADFGEDIALRLKDLPEDRERIRGHFDQILMEETYA